MARRRDYIASSNHTYGLGDVALSFRRLLYRQEAVWPEFTWSLNIRSPTGAKDVGLSLDDWVISGDLNIIHTLRPAFIIASIGLGTGFDSVDPFFQWRIGAALAITYNFNVGADVISTISTDPPNDLLGEQAQLRLRGTYAFTQKVFGEFNVGLGLTDESADTTYTFTVGWSFR